MENIILSGVTLDALLLRIEQLIDAKISILPKENSDSKSDYITRKEVAKLLKITLPTLHDYTKQGYLKSYKLGTRVLYKEKEVKETIEKLQSYKHKKGGML